METFQIFVAENEADTFNRLINDRGTVIILRAYCAANKRLMANGLCDGVFITLGYKRIEDVFYLGMNFEWYKELHKTLARNTLS